MLLLIGISLTSSSFDYQCEVEFATKLLYLLGSSAHSIQTVDIITAPSVHKCPGNQHIHLQEEGTMNQIYAVH